MRIIREVSEMQEYAKNNQNIGFVPTMGFLHEGHLSLVRAAKKNNAKVVASIFVNPKQFLPGEDFEKYPRDKGGDEALLRNEGVDVLFMPDVEEIYSGDFVSVKLDDLVSKWCGKSRPGHFEGVVLVLMKLFNAVMPDAVYLGQKDYQQCVVVKRMIDDLKYSIEFHMLPTVREDDTLALSSRNSYLSQEQKREARAVFGFLSAVKQRLEEATISIMALCEEAKTLFNNNGFELDYFAICDAETLEELATVGARPAVALIAVHLGGVRLIDNILINENLGR